MKNYLVCYYILQQCMFETLEDSLCELLNRISPELWEDGKPTDEQLYNEWSSIIDTEKTTVSRMQKSISEKLSDLEGDFEKTLSVLNGKSFEYYYLQAIERAEEYL